jgi:hypothetical protein
MKFAEWDEEGGVSCLAWDGLTPRARCTDVPDVERPFVPSLPNVHPCTKKTSHNGVWSRGGTTSSHSNMRVQ